MVRGQTLPPVGPFSAPRLGVLCPPCWSAGGIVCPSLGSGGSQPIIKLLMEDITVLRAPLAVGSGLYTLRATGRQAAVLAYASDNGRLWFVLRPASGAKTVIPGFISAQSLLLGLKPVR